MTTIWDTIKSMFGSLTDEEPKPPLHVGEVMSLWTLLTIYEEGQLVYKIALNTTTDPELRHAIENAVKESLEDIKMIKDLLIKESVPLPPVAVGKPVSNSEGIPHGVKFTDEELANLIVGKIAACIALCGQAVSQCLRTDVALILLRSMSRLLQYSAPYRSMMRKRGWLKTPPYYYPPGGPSS
ncbi:DUF3231 family protein [Paenibacillus allorhizosphaerae]|uniref:DUF3231 family protein n=1 Tax=Paenibacillus allorhizosphaerae TaxID=2849866 RepID=A0ABN7TVN4_9BACL|nr:DUF3231 family protein [Paenibacillus allorhizosphaerae]CAG7657467.1 hypothetical protein PAECIP111802_06735 [Paenibacillus allorhizosphaerae]